MAISVGVIGPNSPCKSCNRRAMGCHSMCVEYVEWHEDHLRRKKIYQKEKKTNVDMARHTLDAMKQMVNRSAPEPFRRKK